MPRMAVFGTPSPPDHWASGDIVRIVDPLGTAAGWVAPALAGACVGFFARGSPDEPWRQIVIGDPPDVLGFAPILRPYPEGLSVEPLERWSMLERDPISVTVGTIDPRRDGHVVVQCDEGAVEMTLMGSAFGGFLLSVAAPVGAGSSRWHHDGASRLVIGPDGHPITIEHSPELTATVAPGQLHGIGTLSIHLDLAGRLPTNRSLFARLTAEGFPT